MKSKLRWKASLINKRSRTAAVSLTEEDVEFLVTNTSYSLEEISDWHRQFIAQCPQVNIINKVVSLSLSFSLELWDLV